MEKFRTKVKYSADKISLEMLIQAIEASYRSTTVNTLVLSIFHRNKQNLNQPLPNCYTFPPQNLLVRTDEGEEVEDCVIVFRIIAEPEGLIFIFTFSFIGL